MDPAAIVAVVVALVAAAMAAYALFKTPAVPAHTHAPAPPAPHTHAPMSVLDLVEFKNLHAELRGFYKEHLTDGIFPVMVNQLNGIWTSLTAAEKAEIHAAMREGTRLARLQAENVLRRFTAAMQKRRDGSARAPRR